MRAVSEGLVYVSDAYVKAVQEKDGKMTVIGIDIGTTSICVLSVDCVSGKILKKSVAANAFLPGADGFYAQDAERIVTLAEGLADQLWQGDVAAVGISSQMHGILYVNEEGRACSPFFTWKNEKGNELWRDGKSYADWLSTYTGCPMASGYGSVTHFFLQKTGRIPADAVKLVNIGDYLAMRMTGRREPQTEASLAASFGGFELGSGRFLTDALREAGMDVEYYPDIAGPETVVGDWTGAKVFCACGDNQASFLGAVKEPEHSISVNVGTGSQVSVFHKNLMETEKADIRPFFGKGYLYVGATLTGGKAYEKLAAFFEEIFLKAAGMKVNGYGILETFLKDTQTTDLQVFPSIYGARDGSSAAGMIRNWRESNFHPGDLVAGFLNGMASELSGQFQSMPEELKKEKKKIIASGNGLRKNAGLVRAVERQFGMPVSFSECEEEAAFGAARYAAEAVKGDA